MEQNFPLCKEKVNKGYKIQKKIILFQVSDPLLVCLVLTMGMKGSGFKMKQILKTSPQTDARQYTYDFYYMAFMHYNEA
jgi:hypothetical protein